MVGLIDELPDITPGLVLDSSSYMDRQLNECWYIIIIGKTNNKEYQTINFSEKGSCFESSMNKKSIEYATRTESLFYTSKRTVETLLDRIKNPNSDLHHLNDLLKDNGISTLYASEDSWFKEYILGVRREIKSRILMQAWLEGDEHVWPKD